MMRHHEHIVLEVPLASVFAASFFWREGEIAD
jgi:hypothetical protein